MVSDDSVPGPLLAYDFCSTEYQHPQMAFTKTRKKYVQVMAMGDMKSQNLTKIQLFVVLGHDFQTTTSIRRSKFTFSCIIQPIFSENEKRNASTMFLTHIFAFKVAISFNESLFALKGPKFGSQYLEKKNYHVQNIISQYKITENEENLNTSLPGFAHISQKMTLKPQFF